MKRICMAWPLLLSGWLASLPGDVAAQALDRPSEELIAMAARANEFDVYSDAFRDLLDTGADPNAREPDTGLTPLHAAVLHGRLWSLDVLIDYDVRTDPRAIWRTNSGAWNYPQLGGAKVTPLHLACYLRHPRIVRRLILAGADVNAVTTDSVIADRFEGWGLDPTNGRNCLMLFLGDGPRAYWPENEFELFEYKPWFGRISKAMSQMAESATSPAPSEQALLAAYGDMFARLAGEAMERTREMQAHEASAFSSTPAELDIAVMLVASGIDLTHRDGNGLSAYEHAVNEHRLDVLAYLLEKNPRTQDLARLQAHLVRKIEQAEASTRLVVKEGETFNSPEAYLLWFMGTKTGLDTRLALFERVSHYVAATLLNQQIARRR